MLENEPIMAFVSATDLDRARDFYEGVLGLVVEHVDGFACVLRGGGTMLRVTKVAELRPQPFTVLGWAVGDIAASVAQLTTRGVRFSVFDGFGQDEQAIWTAPGGARVAWFADPDGNTLSLTEFPRA
jgi:catechol 2,3-dioxygenase-like lactoylglutathione lyase family enzyme